MNLLPRLPAAPLTAALRRAAREFQSDGSDGIRSLSRRLAYRLGGNPRSFERQINRMFATGGFQNVSANTADRLCIGIGIHPVLIWPDLWVSAAPKEVA